MAKTDARPKYTPGDPTKIGRDFKKRLRGQSVLLGAIAIEYFRPALAKIYRHAGFDFLFIETEHVFFHTPTFADFVLATRDNGLPCIAKCGQLERAEIARLLDTGIVGIQLPRTESRDDVENLLRYIKFPPQGTRAGAPCYGNVDYRWPADDERWLRHANASTVAVAHIETRRGYENAQEIISTPGLDMVYVGPYDFSIAMGQPGRADHPSVQKAMVEILALCKKHAVPFGTTAANVRAGKKWIARGCRFFEIVDELTLISQGANATVNAYRS